MSRNITVGIHIGHDRSVSVVEDGILIGHLSEERVDRIKHSPSAAFPRKSMMAILDYLGLSTTDVGAYALTYAFVRIEDVIAGLAEDFRAEFELPDIPIYGVAHHLAHAYSVFYTSPFTDAAVVVADGAGDLTENGLLEAESAYYASVDGLIPIWTRHQDIPASYAERRTFFRYPYIPRLDRSKQVSIARKYEQFTYSLGFGWGQSGKTMGLAAYGKPLFDVSSRALQFPEFDLTLEDLVKEIDELQTRSGMNYGSFIYENRADIAATIQCATENIAIAVCQHIYELAPSPNLCLAGGLFLNCVLNHKIIQQTSFEHIHVVPACGDDGQSIGAAFFAYARCFGLKPSNKMPLPYLGLSYSEREILFALETLSANYKKIEPDQLVNEMVHHLMNNQTVALFRGRSEMGPRALGHRSIIASATHEYMRKHLNRYVKHREEFRPFAPMVRWEDQFSYFDLMVPSPHMLLTAQVKVEHTADLKATTHVDGSARIQAVRREDEPFLYELLTEMGKKTGIPILLNTSLNIAGEPIVETPRDALSAFFRSNLDVIFIENYMVTRT